MPELDGLDHVALAVTDVAASARWYEDVLGLERAHADVWGDHPAMLVAGGSGVALFPVKGPEPRPRPGPDVLAMRHVAFRADADNFARIRSELTERGIEYSLQDHTVAHSIYLHDPDGHEVEVTTYEV